MEGKSADVIRAERLDHVVASECDDVWCFNNRMLCVVWCDPVLWSCWPIGVKNCDPAIKLEQKVQP